MKITLYFINFNDSFYLPFIKKHYGEFCQRIVMYDNHSYDNSWELALSLGFECRLFGYQGRLDDEDYLWIKNHCWKEERNRGVDYVIVCDADEFILPDSLLGTAPIVTGYNMISEDLPKESIFEINTGEKSDSYSKQAIFSPDHIKEINFRHGCHKNGIEGLVITGGHCRLIHYRQIGGVQRLIDRHALYRPRMSKFNLKFQLGHHYLVEDDSRRKEWELLKSTAKILW